MELTAAHTIVQSMIDLLSPDCERIEIGVQFYGADTGRDTD